LKVEDGTLSSSFRRDLEVADEFPVFVPSTSYVKNGRTMTVHLMEGYAFVATGLPEYRYFALEKLAYVTSVMSAQSGPHNMRVLHVLPNREIEKLRKKLSEQLAADITVDSWVKVVRGKFKGLEGRVLRLHDDQHAFVAFELRSLHRVTPIPRVFLQTIEPPDGEVAITR
tara:strand:+ start:16014 stop:16523 length:510 start_codon:yes stop_codon:yes gene_type:complete